MASFSVTSFDTSVRNVVSSTRKILCDGLPIATQVDPKVFLLGKNHAPGRERVY
ncbi:uncharacterized protein MYCFIDRAFT_184106 [Pseudocercospora fijiensis CIRAD86]|uniref:Uncharacterized protein n=1 Tax=Pseudocercospora fijiensis (strain CIRAD86) TaxID=383855 RepID=M2YJK4_PSEFD|nr:uncharacterized protein MYCFIDRAFT_184106 [Pseudocercospora fijiensis CIRAD86]EME77930.1 hypothetical protein MYCFIDRAFT_184106 [Pseudocercospora fijiensis CIRAD86]